VQVNINQADMPSDHLLPILTSATYQHLFLRIVSIDVFLNDHFLVYVIRLPLTNNVIYNLYHVLPLPIKIRRTDSKFIFIQPEHDYLFMHTAKRYFTGFGAEGINACKIVNNAHKVSKQTQPVKLTHLDEEYEAQMVLPIRSIPASCSQRIVELNHALWT